MKVDDLINFFNRAIHPLRTTVYLLTGKAVIKSVNDAEGIQSTQISALAGEAMDKVPRIQDFGFSSNPPIGSEAIIISLGGSRENVVVIKADNREVRFKQLASGESAVYTDDGTVIHLKKGGLVDILAATKVLVTCPDVEFTGNVKIDGNLHVVMDAQVDLTLNATVGVGAGYYAGPLGGAPQPVVMDVPLISSSTINSDGTITSGGDVVSSQTSHSLIKTKFNAHKHTENDVNGLTTIPDQVI